MLEITDIYDERIRHYCSLRYTPKQHIDENIFIAEGRRVVEKILNSNIKIISFFATKEFYDEYQNLIDSRQIPQDKQFVASKELMAQVVGFKIHTGIMAIAERPDFCPISELSDTIVATNNIVDAENIGAIIRNLAAFNFDSFMFDKTSTNPYLRRAVRVSMGTVLSTKIHQSINLIDDLYHLKSMGYTILAAEITDHSTSLFDFQFPQKKVIVFGNEANGISRDILDACNTVLHIPINPAVSSINVAASSAIFLSYISTFMNKKS